MNNYLDVTPRYLAAHKKNTRLTLISVMIAVALVTTIFSMLEVFWKFEKQQVISDEGNYHIIIQNVTKQEAEAISSRVDVEKTVQYAQTDDALLDGHAAVLVTGDRDLSDVFSTGLYNRYAIVKGTYPVKKNDVVIENWSASRWNMKVGDTAAVSWNGTVHNCRIAGICADLSTTQDEEIMGVFMSAAGEQFINPAMDMRLMVRFKNHVNIQKAEQSIKSTLHIEKSRISHNERLLAMMGQSMNSTVLGLYATGTVLFVLVLVAGVTMIYNTFQISVMERTRQFGLLRCIGASKSQIRKMVKSEGYYIVLRAVPAGVLIGVLLTFACSAILKFYNSFFFSQIPLLTVSAAGIAAGILLGILTVALALPAPAQKASGVSPLNAVTGNDGKVYKTKKKRKSSETKHTEIVMGIRNALSGRKTFFLMSASIALSVILFLGFQIFISFMYSSMRTMKPYTADVSVLSDKGLSDQLYADLAKLDGIKRVYGRMFGYVDASFDASRLTEEYKKSVGHISLNSDGTFQAPESSWLISYDKNQLKWAKTDLYKGTLSEKKLNEEHGIIAVILNTRKGVSMETAGLKLGDQVTIRTSTGPKKYTVMGILRKVPFADSRANMATFLTTEKNYTEITGDNTLDVIDIQLRHADQEQTISRIREMAGKDVTFSDARQKNAEATQAFLTMAVFMYGFVLVIALISILNIINTMQTSVSSKTKYIGIMRAVGMSDSQLYRMIVAEACTYGLTGCAAGILLGTALQRFLIRSFLSGAGMVWKFPAEQAVIILVVILAVILLSVMEPLRRIQEHGIAETIGSLQ